MNDHDPDDVLRLAQPGRSIDCSGWNVLRWVSMNDKRFANNALVDVGVNTILLHGLTDDGACTCGDRSEGHARSRGKHPVHKNWQTAPLDVDGIDRALIRNWRYNLGIRCGLQPCGKILVVLDFDGPCDSLTRELETACGESFPDTLTAQSGSGGVHKFYWWPDDNPPANEVGILARRSGIKRTKEQGDIDIRSAKGQVVCAPSLHLSGNKYTWLNVREPAVHP